MFSTSPPGPSRPERIPRIEKERFFRLLRFTYQIIFFVVHLGRVESHAVDGEEQVHEGK